MLMRSFAPKNPRVHVGVIDRRSARGGHTGLDEVSACGLLSHTSLLSLSLSLSLSLKLMLNACCRYQFECCASTRGDDWILQFLTDQINGLTNSGSDIFLSSIFSSDSADRKMENRING